LYVILSNLLVGDYMRDVEEVAKSFGSSTEKEKGLI